MNMNNGTIIISELAETLGKVPVSRTLPNGRTVAQVVWEGNDLVDISRLLHNKSVEMPEVVQIDGPAPAWLVVALTHECHPRFVRVNSPDGFVPIGCNKPDGNGEGENISFIVREGEDGWVVVTATAVDPSVPFDPEDHHNWTPPHVPMGSKVILGGRLPNWGMASIAMSYHGTCKAVACFQPGTGSTICWTHTKDIPLGVVLPESFAK